MAKYVAEQMAVAEGPQGLQRNCFYVGMVESDFNELDLIARKILAYKFSSLHFHLNNPIREAMRDVETVACAIVGDGVLLISYNWKYGKSHGNLTAMQHYTNLIFTELLSMGLINIKKCHVIGNKEGTLFHAEMQILDYCISKNVVLHGAVIGVSKPCCKKCATILNISGVDFSLYTKSPIGDWYCPDDIHHLRVDKSRYI